jgi:ribosomal protein L37AE/L43A
LTPVGRASGIFMNKGSRWGGSYAPVQFPLPSLQEKFSKILTLSEHEKDKIVCPHCKSKDVERSGPPSTL